MNEKLETAFTQTFIALVASVEAMRKDEFPDDWTHEDFFDEIMSQMTFRVRIERYEG